MKKSLLAFCIFLSACGDSTDVDLENLICWDEPVDTRFEYSINWNIAHPDTAILVASDDYHVYFFSDAHVGALSNDNDSTHIHFDTILSQARTNQVAALVNVGDVSTGRKKDVKLVADSLASCGVPIYSVIGNHDLFFDGWSVFKEAIGSSTRYFIIRTPVADDLFICMDSGNGTFGAKQLNWLKDLLTSQRNNFRKCIIASHNNIFYVAPDNLTKAPITTPPVEEVNFLLDLFLRYRVNVYISGHFHNEQAMVLGVTSIVTIGACYDGYDLARYLDMHSQDSTLTWTYVGI